MYQPIRQRESLPIRYTGSFTYVIQDTVTERYYNAIRRDDKEEYLRLIKHPTLKKVYARTVFHYDALEIGITILNGETDGIVDFGDILVGGMTPLHYAVRSKASRLTKYLLERGDNIDGLCDDELKQDGTLIRVNPLKLAFRNIINCGVRNSVFEMLTDLCHYDRPSLEILRLLVQYTQDTKNVWKTLFDDIYGEKQKLHLFGAVFLAVPELFLSSNISSFLIKSTDIKEAEWLSLLFDVLNIVGDKLVAYIRLEVTSEQSVEQTWMEIDFLLREVASKMPGVSSPDYYFRFFVPFTTDVDLLSSFDCLDLPKRTWDNFGHLRGENNEPGPWMLDSLQYVVTRKDIDKANIYSSLPILDPDDAGCLKRAIEKKLSSMSCFKGSREDMTQISKNGQKHLPRWFQFFSGRKFEMNVESFPTLAVGAKSMLDFPTFAATAKGLLNFKITLLNSWENKVLKSTKPNFLFSALSVAKRLLK